MLYLLESACLSVGSKLWRTNICRRFTSHCQIFIAISLTRIDATFTPFINSFKTFITNYKVCCLLEGACKISLEVYESKPH